jgi:hypothetical protein
MAPNTKVQEFRSSVPEIDVDRPGPDKATIEPANPEAKELR